MVPIDNNRYTLDSRLGCASLHMAEDCKSRPTKSKLLDFIRLGS